MITHAGVSFRHHNNVERKTVVAMWKCNKDYRDKNPIEPKNSEDFDEGQYYDILCDCCPCKPGCTQNHRIHLRYRKAKILVLGESTKDVEEKLRKYTKRIKHVTPRYAPSSEEEKSLSRREISLSSKRSAAKSKNTAAYNLMHENESILGDLRDLSEEEDIPTMKRPRVENQTQSISSSRINVNAEKQQQLQNISNSQPANGRVRLAQQGRDQINNTENDLNDELPRDQDDNGNNNAEATGDSTLPGNDVEQYQEQLTNMIEEIAEDEELRNLRRQRNARNKKRRQDDNRPFSRTEFLLRMCDEIERERVIGHPRDPENKLIRGDKLPNGDVYIAPGFSLGSGTWTVIKDKKPNLFLCEIATRFFKSRLPYLCLDPARQKIKVYKDRPVEKIADAELKLILSLYNDQLYRWEKKEKLPEDRAKILFKGTEILSTKFRDSRG